MSRFRMISAGALLITLVAFASIDQPLADRGATPQSVATDSCLISVPGDCNASGDVDAADIIIILNYCFKGGAVPNPCAAAGDVNCTGNVTSADLIFEIGYVFKSAQAPCSPCDSPLALECP